MKAQKELQLAVNQLLKEIDNMMFRMRNRIPERRHS